MSFRPYQVGWNEREELEKAMMKNYHFRMASKSEHSGPLIPFPIDSSTQMTLSYLNEIIQGKRPTSVSLHQRYVKKTPYDIFGSKFGPSYSTTMEEKKSRVLVLKDYSRGLEPHPIKVYDDTGSLSPVAPHPDNFLYARTNFLPEDLYELAPIKYPKEHYQTSCNCDGPCGPGCTCYELTKKSLGPAGCKSFHPNRGAIYEHPTHEMSIICCCGPLCSCSSDCSLRLDNLIRANILEVFKADEDVGYCLRTLTNIQYGEFVCEFVGQVTSSSYNLDYSFNLCTEDERDLRERLIDMTENYIKEDVWTAFRLDDIYIDPFRYGNVARMIKHSCLPNLYPLRIVINDWRPHMHHLVLVASCPIPAGSELTFNYGKGYFKRLGKQCKCNSMMCWPTRKIWKSLPEDALYTVMHNYIANLQGDVTEWDKILKHRLEDDDDDCVIINYIPKVKTLKPLMPIKS